MSRKRSHASIASQSQSQDTSQTRLEQHFSQLSINDLVNNCVRYFVYNAGHSGFFRKSDLQKHCTLKAGQALQQVIENASAILENVYGYKLLVCDQTAGSGKAFVITNALPYKNYDLDKEEPDNNDKKKVLLLLILSHIFMTNSPVAEASLYSFLGNFQINVNVKHPIFGSVKDYISTLIKQKYLSTETNPLSKNTTYTWGIHAEKEISKHQILKFVCKMYQDRQPKSWTNHFKIANEQGFNNEGRTQNDVDLEE